MNSIIEWFARHPVASNLLMGFLLIGGLISMSNTSQEAFPEFTLEIIQVEVPYVGASPDEIEKSIIQPLEQQLNGVEGVKEVTASAAEGVGLVKLEFSRTADIGRALNDVKSEVDRITVFPDDAEEPIVSQVSGKTRVAEIAISGTLPEATLKELAYRIKDDLVLEDNISLIEVKRARDYEISIEVSRDSLRAYDLTLADLSAAIRLESLELPGGDIDTAKENILIRTVGRNLTRQDFEEIIVSSSPSDGIIRVRDIARVIDGFQKRTQFAEFNGKPAVFLDVFRVGDERVLDVIDSAETYIDQKLKPSLPDSVDVVIWRNDAVELDQRIDLLVKNAILGILLVALALTLFLDLRLAFWVSAGIGVSFTAAFIPMSLLGLSINSLSMFGFILAIGIVVDDAIVTGENIFAEAERGTPPMEAAVKGASRVAAPVIFAVSTTVAAFVPLLLLPGILGKFLTDIPAVVIILLGLSLIESLLILPHHLSHINVKEPPSNVVFRFFAKARDKVDGALKRFIEGPLERVLDFTTKHWFVTITGAVTVLVLSIGILANGYIKFSFFPQIEGNYVTASVEMAEGTSLQRTEQLIAEVEQLGLDVARDMATGKQTVEELMLGQLVLVGTQEEVGGPPGSGGLNAAKSNQGSVVIQLAAPEDRDFSSSEFETRWREALVPLRSQAKISVASSLVSLGAAVQVEVSADTESSLREAIRQTEAGLNSIAGVFDVRNDFDAGKREFKIELKDEARRYGLSLQSLALQVRGAFFGDEALRVQRGRDEVRVYVRLPESERSHISDLFDYRIQASSGEFIPLSQVANVTETLSPSTINRRNGRRLITITADVDNAIISGQQANGVLTETILPKIEEAVPDVRFEFGGEAREMGDVGSVLGRNFMLALLAIFILLAIPFRSYSQPIVVMLAIPFGLVGAVLGHLVMDLYMGLLSIFGIVGLAGVVINGALVQVDFANEMRSQGVESRLAWIEAGKSRFRPIFLTALTTFLGVGPLMLEQSVQAQFLIPMAASIAFGVLIGTFIQMLLVPALGSMLDHFALVREQRNTQRNAHKLQGDV